jgi:hypothetical protein
MRFGEVSLDPDDYPEFMVGRSWGPLPAVDGFGDPATPVAVPSATTVPGDWVDPDTTYASPEMRLMDVAPYDDRTGYQPQFPEQEDLSIFGWTDYPDPAVGFGGGPLGENNAFLQFALGLAVFGGVGAGAGYLGATLLSAKPGTVKVASIGGAVAGAGAALWLRAFFAGLQ